MAKAAIRGVLRAAKVDASAVTDAELLRRFAEGDQAAFTTLVRRHTDLVLGVCRRALPTAADAEDACQAVFVVLARKARGVRWQASVANWLYATARKVSRDARVAAGRRVRREAAAGVPMAAPREDRMSAHEGHTVLDDELDRLPAMYREPLVLCYLEGLSREDAAVRLGVPAATVKIRLERGRKRLGDALRRRGVAVGLGLLALASTSPAGASPPQLHESILAAAGGTPPEPVAALARGVAMNGVLTRTRLAVMAVVGLAAVGFGAATMPAPADPPKPTGQMEKPKAEPKTDAKPGEVMAKTVTGTVVGPDGKPVAGASVRTLKVTPQREEGEVEEVATTDAVGRFTFRLTGPADPRAGWPLVAVKKGYGPGWVTAYDHKDGPLSLTLAADDVPVKGRVTDLEGKAVAKATVRVTAVSGVDLTKVWEEWPRNPYQALNRTHEKLLHLPKLGGLPAAVTADADGRFEITGVGRGRLLALTFEGEGIEVAACRVALDPAFDPKKVERPTETTMPGGAYQPGPALYGPTFTHAGLPSQPVVGTVTDSKTGKPLGGVQVSGHVSGPHWYENHTHTKTDADGKFVLKGVAKTDRVRLSVFPTPGQPYFMYSTTVSGQPGLTEIPAELKLTRGVLVTGRVIEKGTGKPVAGAGVRYAALGDNKFYPDLMKGRQCEPGMAWASDADGRFEFVALPGSGVVTAQGETRGAKVLIPYTQVRVAKDDLSRANRTQLDNMGEMFVAADGHYVTLHSLSGYAVIDPKPTDDTADVVIEFDRGKTVSGKVVDPDGRPANGVTAYRLTACYSYPETLTDGTFTAVALEPDHPRVVVFADPDKKLAAAVELTGEEKPVTVKLQPWGKLTGRLLDADGKPVAGARVSANPQPHLKYSGVSAALHDRTATTGEDGRFTLDVPATPAAYRLGFQKKNVYLNTGYDPADKGHTMKPGEATDVGDVKVERE